MFGAMNQMDYLANSQQSYWQVGSTYTNSTNAPGAVDVDSSNNVFVVSCDSGIYSRATVVKYNNLGVGQWGKVLGDGTTVALLYEDVVADSSGNVYASGYIDSADGLLVKYDSTGAVTWQIKWNISGRTIERGYGIALSANGNIIVGGIVDDDVVVIAFNSSGAVVWAIGITAGSIQQVTDVTTDSSNNVYIVARNLDSNDSALIVKLNSSGTEQWQRTLSDSDTGEFVTAIDTDSSGNVYITMEKPSYQYLAKYNSSGTLQWQRSLIIGANGYVRDMIVDQTSGNIYQVGSNYSSSLGRGFVCCYNSSGTIQWQRSVQTSGNCNFNEIALDSNGDLIITGDVSGFAGAVVWKLPNTGSSISAWTWNSLTFNYVTTTFTEEAGDLTSATSTYTISSRTATTTTTTYTNTTRTLTNVLATITV
jgi:hypothetical protein